jgi:hypothetical protein
MRPSVNLVPRPRAETAARIISFGSKGRQKDVKVDAPGKNASEEDQEDAEADLPPEFRGTGVFARVMFRNIDVGGLGEGNREGGREGGQDWHGRRWSRAIFVNYGFAKLKTRESRIVTFTFDAHREGYLHVTHVIAPLPALPALLPEN